MERTPPKYYDPIVWVFATAITIGGCGFTITPQNGQSRDGLSAQGWDASIPNLDSGSQMAFLPQIAVEPDPANNGGADDGQSSAIAVWVKLQDPDPFDINPQQVYRLYAAHFNGASGWAIPQVIDAGSANYNAAWAPRVAMDDIGNAVVVWQQWDGTSERIYERRYLAGSGWSSIDVGCPLGNPDSTGNDGICLLDTGGGAAGPAIALDPTGAGTAMTVYTRGTSAPDTDTGQATSVGAVTLTDTSKTWIVSQWVGATVTITGGPGSGQSRTVQSNSGSDLTVVTPWAPAPAAGSTYTLTGGGTFRAFSRRLTGGIAAGSWGTETNIDTLSCCQSFATVHSGGTDATDNVGQWTSTAVDKNGNVHISYYAVNGAAGVSGGADLSNTTNLRYSFNFGTVCVDGGCLSTSANVNVGQYTSLAVDVAGRVYISYYDATNFDLKFATCGSECLHLSAITQLADNWTTVCVDGTAGTCIAQGATTSQKGQYTSLVQDSTGRLHLAYQSLIPLGVLYTSCLPASGNSYCTAANSWSLPATLPGAPDNPAYISMVISASSSAGSPGLLHVAYEDTLGASLRYDICDITSSGTNCTNAAGWGAAVSIPAVSPTANWISLKSGPSSTIGALDRLHLVYYDTVTTQLSYTTCDLTSNNSCLTNTNWTAVAIIDSASANNGQYTGLAIDGNGRLHVSYYDVTNADLKYDTCDPAGGAGCTVPANWTPICLEGTTGATCRSPIPVNWNTGQYTSIAADNSGEVAIAYYEQQTSLASTDGLRLRLATSLGRSTNGPTIAMDDAGNAVSAFLREALMGCDAVPKVNTSTAAGTDNPDGSPLNNRNSELSSAGCYARIPGVNKFDAAASGWLGGLDISRGAPTQAVSTTTGTTSNICFQEGSNPVGAGAQDQNVAGLNSACVNFSQLRVAMDRTGDASVVMKLSWNENESANGCSPTFDDAGHGGALGNPSDDPLNAQANQCAPVDSAWDEWNGDSVATERYAAGAAWSLGSWTNTYLYAHSNQPSDAGADPNNVAVAVISNCPSFYIDGSGGDETTRKLLNCRVNVPQIAMSGDVNGTTLAAYERFDGTNHDIFVDCFTLGGDTCGPTPLPALTCVDGNLNDGWRSVSCSGATFRGNGFVPPPAGTTGPTVTTPYLVLNNTAVSRNAYTPQVAMDSTGNGLAVWAEQDGTQWRVYGMRFIAGFGGCTVGTDCGFVTSSRVPIDALGFDPTCSSGSCFYSNPVLSMEWVHLDAVGHTAALCGGIASCGDGWTVMLDVELYGGGLLPPLLNVRVQGHQWTPP